MLDKAYHGSLVTQGQCGGPVQLMHVGHHVLSGTVDQAEMPYVVALHSSQNFTRYTYSEVNEGLNDFGQKSYLVSTCR